MKHKYIFLIILSLFFLNNSYCDDIFLKDGKVFRNIQVVQVDSNIIKITIFPQGYNMQIARSSVVNYVKKDLDSGLVLWSKSVREIESELKTYEVFERDSSLWYKQKTFPKIGFLSITILSFALCYDYWEDVNSTQKSIDFYSYQLKQLGQTQGELSSKYQSVLDELKSVKSRKNFVKWIALASGVGSLVFALQTEEVEVKLTPINIGIKWIF